MTTYDMITKTV